MAGLVVYRACRSRSGLLLRLGMQQNDSLDAQFCGTSSGNGHYSL